MFYIIMNMNLTKEQILTIEKLLKEKKRIELTPYKDGTLNIAIVERKRIEY